MKSTIKFELFLGIFLLVIFNGLFLMQVILAIILAIKLDGLHTSIMVVGHAVISIPIILYFGNNIRKLNNSSRS